MQNNFLGGILVISPEQIRAGRALLRWSAKDLASRAGLVVITIQRLETGKTPVPKASVETVQKITNALESAGVVLLPDGVGVTLRKERD